METLALKTVSRCLDVVTMALCGLLLPVKTAMAQAGTPVAGFDNICLTEVRRAEAQHGTPSGLLQSIPASRRVARQ